jgi:hypothetical protein
MLARDSRRQRQQERVEGEPRPKLQVELLELAEEVLDVRCCWMGSGAGRWAAWVCSCSRREASEGLVM